ncbi:hypothetical protein SCHPADRAFT_926100 [Schizopora paradoxa]|uniref:Uncharacterized protein n=1 Tax=Schizopora paradoxa TaxID=27342 RepID=A0A0H2S5T9_9AGAM|nr:hypothetical protein SCHPADRAFT_926100 [Schizopora paradoxa]
MSNALSSPSTMFDANQNNSVLTVSPPDSGFAPRREFVRDNHVPSSFALLSIAGASLVRLSSFPRTLKAELKRALELRASIRAVREDTSLNLLEFNLEGKPWASGKSIHSEMLFLNILSIILFYGFRYVSSIDYGREHDDKLCIAFSRPDSSPDTHRSHFPVVFAISFPSSTILRVINAPLNSTPAILQGVRSAWPRGVVSEKTVSDKCYEFKLKGYKWFQEDTFATDSLQQIMSILQTLDRHAFSLLASLSLSGGRSRMKDLWIFTGTSHGSPSDSVFGADLTRLLSDSPSSEQQHHRASSLPNALLHPNNNSPSHARSASTPEPHNRSPSVLRKKNSRTLGGTPPLRSTSEDSEQRLSASSASEVIDMTGIGTLRQRLIAHQMMSDDVDPMQGSSRYVDEAYIDPSFENTLRRDATSGRIKTGEIFYMTPPTDRMEEDQPALSPDNSDGSNSHSGSSNRLALTPRESTEGPQNMPQDVDNRVSDSIRDSTPQILSPGTFRDSKFSSTSGYSCEIPIAWTGGPEGNWKNSVESSPFFTSPPGSPEPDRGQIAEKPRRAPFGRHSTPLNFPGGWQPTPIEEKPEENLGFNETSSSGHGELEHQHHDADRNFMPERKEVDAARVASPILAESPAATRKSEVALYDMAPPKRRASYDSPCARPSTGPASPSPIASGWVLVNVERPRDSRSASFSSAPRTPTGGSKPGTPRGPAHGQQRDSQLSQQQEFSMSPVAKVIAAADAVSNVPVEPVTQPPSSGGLLKIFSNTKVKSRRLTPDGRVVKVKELEREELEQKGRKKSRKLSIRDRLRNNSSDNQ